VSATICSLPLLILVPVNVEMLSVVVVELRKDALFAPLLLLVEAVEIPSVAEGRVSGTSWTACLRLEWVLGVFEAEERSLFVELR
jgi:hypothetical protein